MMNEKVGPVLLFAILAIRLVTLPIHPLTDPTEARYATVMKEMIRAGDWTMPRIWIDGKLIPYLGKPPLHFWAGALSAHLFGANEFAVRFPSLLGAALLVILMVAILRRHGDPDLAYPGALILSSSILFFALAGAVVIDMTLALFVAGAVFFYQAFVFESTKGGKRLWSLGIFSFLGLGFLTKGPVAIIMFGIPVFLFTLIHRRWKDLKDLGWWTGGIVFLALTVPWFWIAEAKNPGFLRYFFLQENFLRFIVHNYGDLYGAGRTQPYGAAAVMLFLAGFPWTFSNTILLLKRQGWKQFSAVFKDERTSLFALAVAGITLFLCFARQLVIPYVLPVLPFLAIWSASFLKKWEVNKRTIMRISIALVILYGVGYPLTSSFVEKRFSTKSVVRVAQEVGNHSEAKGNLSFLPTVPYSAYFYGQNFVRPHSRKDMEVAALRELNAGEKDLYAVRRRDLGEVSPRLLNQLKPLRVFGDWTLYCAK